MKTLTIAIPTYKRTEELIRLLRMIDSEIVSHGFGNRIEVLIRDNSDDDKTATVMAESGLAAKPWLNYQRNSSNLGFDLNVLNLYCAASCDYVWLFGDDDILFPGSIQKVLELIETGVDIIHLPFRQPEGLKRPQYQLHPRVKYWTDAEGAAEQVLKYIKITSFVYRRGDVEVNKEKLAEQFNNTGWMHLALGLECLFLSKSIKTITLSEFFAGSLDKEWRVISWSPTPMLTAPLLGKHDLVPKFRLQKLVDEFDRRMYLGGIILILLVEAGTWFTKGSIDKYVEFGAQYPFRKYLATRPHWLMRYLLIRYRLAGPLKGPIRLATRLKGLLRSESHT